MRETENQNRLITIPISHYCEKARWALDWSQMSYSEERHLQGFHYWPVYRAAQSSTAPVLITSEGTFSDSSDILQWCNSKASQMLKLYPTEANLRHEVEEFEEYLDEGLGVAGRLWMYTYMLQQLPLILHYSKKHGVPWYERKMLPIIFPFLKGHIDRALQMTPTSQHDTFIIVNGVFDEISKILSDRRRFLFGEQFSAADLTFAALAAPVLIPENYGVSLPSLEELPKPMQEQISLWRQTLAGQFALRLYREYRRPLIEEETNEIS